MSIIGVIDSGYGGISTLSSIIALLPNEDYIYVADKSSCPYGSKDRDFINNRMLQICLMLKELGVRAVVVACNTATNASIKFLRKSFNDLIIVGVEPAIKPAYNELTYGKILVLLTPLTAKQEKFLQLISNLDKNKIILAPQPRLATLIEENINNLYKIKSQVEDILLPYVDNNIESIVLGCTHYCLIKDQIQSIFNAKIYDGNAGVAARLYHLLNQNKLLSRKFGGSIKFITL